MAGVRVTVKKIIFLLVIIISPLVFGDEYKGKAEYIDSTEVPFACAAESICVTPYWHRYAIKAKSKMTGEFVQVIAAHRHTEIHDTDFEWIFKLRSSEESAEKQFIHADWVIYELQVLVGEQP